MTSWATSPWRSPIIRATHEVDGSLTLTLSGWFRVTVKESGGLVVEPLTKSAAAARPPSGSARRRADGRFAGKATTATDEPKSPLSRAEAGAEPPPSRSRPAAGKRPAERKLVPYAGSEGHGRPAWDLIERPPAG